MTQNCEPCQPFCGRKVCSEDNSTSLQECGPCPWGWQNTTINLSECSICQPCSDQVDLYDWLFFVFIMIAVYGIHFQAIIRLSGRLILHYLVDTFCSWKHEIHAFRNDVCFFRSLLGLFGHDSFFFSSWLASINLLLHFRGKFIALYNCVTSLKKVYLEKWYPFVDAVPGRYELFQSQKSEFNGEGCLYEVVYPRFSLPLFSMLLSIVLTLFGRPAFLYFSGKTGVEKPMEPYLFSPYLEALHRLPYAILTWIANSD